MNFQEPTIKIFQLAYDRLKPYQSLIKNHPAIIAFSGGKDSTLLSRFYQYLFSQSICPEPFLFHLDHSIRDNSFQEKEIKLEMESLSTKTFIKKKTFQIFLKSLKEV